MEEEHARLVGARPELVVVLRALAVDQILGDGGEVVGIATEAVDSIAEDVAAPWVAGTAACYEAVSVGGGLEVADTEAPI